VLTNSTLAYDDDDDVLTSFYTFYSSFSLSFLGFVLVLTWTVGDEAALIRVYYCPDPTVVSDADDVLKE
jgi:hypothetical protein